MQIIYCEDEHKYKVYKYKRMISEEEMKTRREFYEYDASIDTWNSFYLNVYFGGHGVETFKDNFDYTKPEERGRRIVIPAKENSVLVKNYQDLWREKKIPGEPIDFYISGDCDIKYDGISEEDRHGLLNLSMMPITGGLNDEKGSRGSVNDVFSDYIKKLPDLISNPHSMPGKYKKELKEYKLEIVKCARQAYFNLFDNNIDKYFYNVHFFGINDSDKSEKLLGLFEQVNRLLEDIKGNRIDEETLAKEYWKLRKEILKEKFGIDL